MIRDRQKPTSEVIEKKNKVAELITKTKTKQNYYNNSVNDARHSNPAKWFKSIYVRYVYALSGCLQSRSTTGASSHPESVIMAGELLRAFTDHGKTVTQPSNIIMILSEKSWIVVNLPFLT